MELKRFPQTRLEVIQRVSPGFQERMIEIIQNKLGQFME